MWVIIEWIIYCLCIDAMTKPYWGVDDVIKIVQLMCCVRNDRLMQTSVKK